MLFRSLDHDGHERTYRVHVPRDATPPLPVVFDSHGLDSDASQQDRLSGMSALGDDEGFVTVHPEGFGSSQSWNAGACCGVAMEMHLDDVGLVRAMVDDLAAHLCIDRARIYATGESNGGFLSHRLGCEAADVFAAVAPVAGVLGIDDDDCVPSRPMPVVHHHGTADFIVPYQEIPFVGWYRSVPDTFAGWAERDRCRGEPAESFHDGDVSCDSYSDCDGGAEVTLFPIDGGGHLWPGGGGTTRRIWQFLSRFSL